MDLPEVVYGVIFSLVSAGVGILVAWWYSSRRKLLVAIPSAYNFIDIEEIANKKIKVTFDGDETKSLWILRVVVFNAGNHDISKRMVSDAPRLHTGKGTKILDVEALNLSKQANVTPSIEDENTLRFEIDYLKKGRYLAYQLLLDAPGVDRLIFNDIKLDPGIIENTSVSYKAWYSDKSRKTVRHVASFVMQHHNVISFVCLGFSLVFASLGFALAFIATFSPSLFNWLNKEFAKPMPNNIAILSGIVVFFMGASMFVETIVAYRRLKYRNLFVECIPHVDTNPSEND